MFYLLGKTPFLKFRNFYERFLFFFFPNFRTYFLSLCVYYVTGPRQDDNDRQLEMYETYYS